MCFQRWIIIIVVMLSFYSFGICEEFKLAYTNDSTSIVTSSLIQAVMVEKLNSSVKMAAYPPDQLWDAVATGKADAMVSAWLPQSHAAMLKKHKGQVEILKPVTLGVKIGFVTPTYVTIDTLDQLSSKLSRFKNEVYCIKDHTGSIEMTKRAIAAYGLKNLKCVVLPEQALINKIEACEKKLDWIMLGIWSPHIIFSQFKIKFLDDPKGVFSKDEQIVAVSKASLSKEDRDAYAILKKFYCSPKELQEIMGSILKNNKTPYGAAKDYVNKNPEQVKKWIVNVKKGHQKRRLNLK